MSNVKVNQGNHGTRCASKRCVIIQNTTHYPIIADESAFVRWMDDELIMR